jgi:C-terminal processing protease CtpA/Prc
MTALPSLLPQIQPGDVLLKIDGRDVVGLCKADMGNLLLGAPGSAASLTLKRGPAWKGGEGKTYHVDLHRSWAPAGLKDVPDGL